MTIIQQVLLAEYFIYSSLALQRYRKRFAVLVIDSSGSVYADRVIVITTERDDYIQ